MKKIKKLLIGTNNIGKFEEIRALLPRYIKILSTYDFKIKSPLENGNTFESNSIIKSKYFSKKTNMVCLADDSGLEIDVLDGAPGIYSARWGGKNSNFKNCIRNCIKKINMKNFKTFLEISFLNNTIYDYLILFSLFDLFLSLLLIKSNLYLNG